MTYDNHCKDNKRPCVFRKEKGKCIILKDTDFPGGQCRFRKTEVDGPNMYDKERCRHAK